MVRSSKSQNEKEKKERKIFRQFAKATGLPVVPNSITSCTPPAPDILCEIHGRGPVGFELVEIVTPALSREHADRQKLEKAFGEECKKHPEMGVRYKNAHICVGFKRATLMQRLSVVPDVVDALLQLPDSFKGSVSVPRNLRQIILEIFLKRNSARPVQTTVVDPGPMFCVAEATKRTEEIVRSIEKKCNKRYTRNPPIELLAYYRNQPSSDHFNWKGGFHDNVVKKLSESSCPFGRVWVYDCWKRSILFVHPPLS